MGGELLKSYKVKKVISKACKLLADYESRCLASNYREREKILLAMPPDAAKSGEHEVFSRVLIRLHCVCIANICGLATALSGKASATVWRRSNYHWRRFDSVFCGKTSRYSAEVRLHPVARSGLCDLRGPKCALTKLRCDDESATRLPPLRNH